MSFVVVQQSMQIRYFLETIFFFLLACYFQYELLEWTASYNETRKINKEFVELFFLPEGSITKE